jgi:hypothetical protein
MEAITENDAIVAASIVAVQARYQSSKISLRLSEITQAPEEEPPTTPNPTDLGEQLWLDPRDKDWHDIAYSFCRNSLGTEHPDFNGLQEALESKRSKAYEINNAWTTLTIKLRDHGKTTWLGNQCAVRGLSHFPKARVTTWGMLTIPDAIPKAEILRDALRRIEQGDAGEATISKVLVCLKGIFGEPGDREKSEADLTAIVVDI